MLVKTDWEGEKKENGRDSRSALADTFPNKFLRSLKNDQMSRAGQRVERMPLSLNSRARSGILLTLCVRVGDCTHLDDVTRPPAMNLSPLHTAITHTHTCNKNSVFSWFGFFSSFEQRFLFTIYDDDDFFQVNVGRTLHPADYPSYI